MAKSLCRPAFLSRGVWCRVAGNGHLHACGCPCTAVSTCWRLWHHIPPPVAPLLDYRHHEDEETDPVDGWIDEATKQRLGPINKNGLSALVTSDPRTVELVVLTSRAFVSRVLTRLRNAATAVCKVLCPFANFRRGKIERLTQRLKRPSRLFRTINPPAASYAPNPP